MSNKYPYCRGAPVQDLADILRQNGQELLKSRISKKYRNVRTPNGDGTFSDSKKEARIDGEYQILLRCGQLRSVERKKRFPIVIAGIKICDYECDWVITDTAGNVSVVDAKGLKTRVYRLKKKLMKAIHGIDIIER